MIYIEIDKRLTDDFLVYDENNNSITGLTKSDFTVNLYNPSKVDVADSPVSITVDEIESGLYRIAFTPNVLGAWTLKVIHTTHFPAGQGQNYTCVESVDEVDEIAELKTLIKRVLGLSQENYRLFNPEFDNLTNMTSGIVKTYPTALDVDNDTNALATYEVTAEYDNTKLLDYRMKKIA